MHKKTGKLDARTIAAAKRGNKVAMEKILDYFRPKLIKKATLTMYDRNGMPHTYINCDLLIRFVTVCLSHFCPHFRIYFVLLSDAFVCYDDIVSID